MVIIFDLNGTLLDTRSIAPAIRKVFGKKITAEQWLHTVLHYSAAMSVTGDFCPFEQLAAGVLAMEADAHNIKLKTSDVERVQTALRTMPPYKEVARALKTLRTAGFRLAVLTNSCSAVMRQQLAHSGLGDYFDHAISVEDVHMYKPSLKTYNFAATSAGVHPQEMLMVAAHSWDLIGASRAGCQTAFIRRPGKAPFPGFPVPTYTARDLSEFASELTGATRSVPKLALIAAGAAAIAAGAFVGVKRLPCQPS